MKPHENLDPLLIGGKAYGSRLLVGTGKYKDFAETRAAIDASGAQIVTVAIRRTNIGQNPNEPSLLDAVPATQFTLLPNTAGCFNAADAVRVARLGRELLEQLGNAGQRWVKLEVLRDKATLLPDPIGTIEACAELVKDGFEVLCYSSDDPIAAVRLRDAGATSVMPAGSPIGSGRGIANREAILILIDLLKNPAHGGNAHYPVIVDAGVGTPSDVTLAMELGADGVLLNTGIAHATDPIHMAHAMHLALEAGYFGYKSGRIARKLLGTASSPWSGTFTHIPGE
jgi:thiazole synthase